MVRNQGLARENVQSKVYFYVRALSFKVFLQLASLRESPLQKSRVNMARCAPQHHAGKYECRYFKNGTTTRCRLSFDRQHDCDRHERTHLRGAARAKYLHHCPLGSRCHRDFKNLQLGNLRTHIKTVHRDIQHLICQICRPFVLTADPAAFARHQAEQHSGWHPAQQPRTVSNPTPPTTPASSPPDLSPPSAPKTIKSVPLATRNRARPVPNPAMYPHCSFMIMDTQRRLPAEGPRLKPIVPPPDPREARTPDYGTQSRALPPLRDFLRDTCGIELTQRRHHAHH
ncbi:hypothetical protein IW261DRAFT_1642022 [Armillaria novae-zelandiae]|uniref:Uncharacterized protein n=1 Tax=Armillaria novae-zelandiae TaxID=153914 RepID=A0AA39P2W3_9AGAR|nr:hypothetical protein IW261DRAFT_1642022 [Armillaria novae-zelandiae]